MITGDSWYEVDVWDESCTGPPRLSWNARAIKRFVGVAWCHSIGREGVIKRGMG